VATYSVLDPFVATDACRYFWPQSDELPWLATHKSVYDLERLDGAMSSRSTAQAQREHRRDLIARNCPRGASMT
jgi:hypothetical protein